MDWSRDEAFAALLDLLDLSDHRARMQLAAASRDAGDMRTALESGHADNTKLQIELGAVRADNAKLQAELEAARADSANLRTVLTRLEQENRELGSLLHRLTHSLSWRVTLPLRAVRSQASRLGLRRRGG